MLCKFYKSEMKNNLSFSKKVVSLQNNFLANHNKDYSVVKTFKAGEISSFLLYISK